ncbi:PD40 domain-containing protein, partial [Candidatus Bipolaricaulota bacterium]|nr:PD40 domain-containing protein [Candidatus Bipolaricaulota bacterium]
MKRVAKQYGLWKSSITPYVLSQGIRIADLGWDSDGETLVWLEERAGHGVLVAKHRKKAAHDLTCELSVRARVGYGGGDFTVSHGMIYFVADGRIYRQSLSAGAAQSVTPAYGQAASPCISPDGRWMLYVHSDGLEDVLAIIDVEGKLWPQKLVAGDDFYMQPCWHPSGEKIAWISWRHPQMPWEGTTAHLAKLDMGKEGLPSVEETRIIAGGESTCIFQPEFSPDGRYLAYISDERGFGSLYLYDLSANTHRQLTNGNEELAMPAWIQGMRTYGFSYTSREIICRVSSGGINRLERVDIETGTAEQLEQFSDYTLLSQLVPSPTENAVAVIAQSAVTPARVVTCTFTVQEQPRIHRYSTAAAIPDGELSTPEVVSWPAQDGGEVHGFYYQPRNEAFVGIGLPPVIIMVHGGP